MVVTRSFIALWKDGCRFPGLPSDGNNGCGSHSSSGTKQYVVTMSSPKLLQSFLYQLDTIPLYPKIITYFHNNITEGEDNEESQKRDWVNCTRLHFFLYFYFHSFFYLIFYPE